MDRARGLRPAPTAAQRTSLARAPPSGGSTNAGTPEAAPPRSAIDRALLDGDLDRARELALRARMHASALAVRAAALGALQPALEQSALVLAADPSSSDARVAALVAADLATDAARFDRALEQLDDDPLEPGPLATWLLADLLRRRVGPDAAKAWLAARGPLRAPADDVEKAVAGRLSD